MKRIYWVIIIVACGIMLLWLLCLPRTLFADVLYSTIVNDKNGNLLGARVAKDGQWRFPMNDTLPEKFVKSLIEFEDHYYYSHCGVSIRSLVRATIQNIRNGRVVSGGSTISMQLIRLSRQKPRTLYQKIIEMFLATRLESRFSKDEILKMYATHAPFGGNVVGIRAAMWRYLGNDNVELSWAEAATLAVLQNAPSLIHLDKNRDNLLAKRNRLLTRLYEKGEITKDDYLLAIEEPLIGKPYPMPRYAPHLVEYYHKVSSGKEITTSIDLHLQQRVEELSLHWNKELRQQYINDLAIIIQKVETGEIVAYCGNSDISFERNGMWVDIGRAPRSSGSVLKPLLYALALQEGVIQPKTLLPDIPTDFGGFVPKNFDGTYAGAIAADEALALSLNIPSVYLLKKYGVARFAYMLQQLGFISLNRPANEYGLSLVLGGAEVRLIDLVSCYAKMAFCYIDSTANINYPIRDKIAIYHTLEAMREVNRPDQIDWHRVESVQNVAWKTGTSYGSRDAWAVGVTPQYVVGVWVGNADGSGVANLTGARCAGPILFDVFGLLPYVDWFNKPNDTDGELIQVCRHSGYRASRFCSSIEEQLLPRNSAKSDVCPYCTEIQVSLDGQRIVADRCEPARAERYFTLPSHMEYYYKQHHPEYNSLSTIKLSTILRNQDIFQFIYPSNGSIMSLAKQMNGDQGVIICKIAHIDPKSELFWHLDGSYIGSTTDVHNMQIQPSLGNHIVTAVDNYGNQQSIHFIVK